MQAQGIQVLIPNAPYPPTEICQPVSYWQAYLGRIELWSILNLVSRPSPNMPQKLYPGMRVIVQKPGDKKPVKGIFAGFVYLQSGLAKIVIINQMIHQPWMDRMPELDKPQIKQTLWEHNLKSMGGISIMIRGLPMTFYPSVISEEDQKIGGTPKLDKVPVPKANLEDLGIKVDDLQKDLKFPEMDPATEAEAVGNMMVPPEEPVELPPVQREKIIKIGNQTCKLMGDKVYTEQWVDMELEEQARYRVADLIVDGKTIAEPDSYKLQKLDWVEQEQ